MKEQSYTSTPTVGRTACTEPQCLYKGALYLFLFFVPVCIACPQLLCISSRPEKLILEDGSDKLSQNVRKELLLYAS